MARGIDFRQKQVININDGKILGQVLDVDANFENGEIHSIIVGNSGLFNVIGFKNNIVINWDKIVKVGEDVILVEI